MDGLAAPSIDEVVSLQGAIVGQAEKNPLPDRFVVNPLVNSPHVWIIDTETGRKTEVPLFAYGNVRQVLNELFPTPKPVVVVAPPVKVPTFWFKIQLTDDYSWEDALDICEWIDQHFHVAPLRVYGTDVFNKASAKKYPTSVTWEARFCVHSDMLRQDIITTLKHKYRKAQSSVCSSGHRWRNRE
jgi:hypothetical protein